MWVAKEQNGLTRIYTKKPIRKGCVWYLPDDGDCFNVEHRLFPDLKWEDEPKEIFITENNTVSDLQVHKWLRLKTGCGLLDAKIYLNKLVEAIKNKPKNVLDARLKLVYNVNETIEKEI